MRKGANILRAGFAGAQFFDEEFQFKSSLYLPL
jgi:hypothetical protein